MKNDSRYQRAFVVQLDPARDRLEGRAEHVLSGVSMRFATGDELLAFLAGQGASGPMDGESLPDPDGASPPRPRPDDPPGGPQPDPAIPDPGEDESMTFRP